MATRRPVPAAEATLRCHKSAVVSLAFDHFYEDAIQLASADEEGFIVIWDLIFRRPKRIWKAHSATVLRMEWIQANTLMTHSRDNSIVIWRISLPGFETEPLAAGSTTAEVSQLSIAPWKVSSMPVNALNFCGFSYFGGYLAIPGRKNIDEVEVWDAAHDFILKVDAISTREDPKTGMAMSLGLFRNKLLVGYDSGHVCCYNVSTTEGKFDLIYVNKAHSQPVLSLAVNPVSTTFFTSAADSILAEHPIECLKGSISTLREINTKHAGIGALDIRQDGKLIACTGWDGLVRVFTYSKLKQVAAFKGGRQSGITFAVFSPLVRPLINDDEEEEEEEANIHGLDNKRKIALNNRNWIAVAGKDSRIGLWQLY